MSARQKKLHFGARQKFLLTQDITKYIKIFWIFSKILKKCFLNFFQKFKKKFKTFFEFFTIYIWTCICKFEFENRFLDFQFFWNAFYLEHENPFNFHVAVHSVRSPKLCVVRGATASTVSWQLWLKTRGSPLRTSLENLLRKSP